MAKDLSSLQKQIKRLEYVLQDYENDLADIDTTNYTLTTFNKKLLNLAIIENKSIKLATFFASAGVPLILTANVEFSTNSNQMLGVEIHVNGKSIKQADHLLSSTLTNFEILTTFVPEKNQEITVSLTLEPKEQFEVIIKEIKLNIFGANISVSEDEFHALETSNGLLISKNVNGQIFYQFVNESFDNILEDNFKFFANGISHQFITLTNQNKKEKIFLFKVSDDGKLFVVDFDTKIETFITQNVSKISASSNGMNAVIAMLKSGACEYFEFNGNIGPIFNLDFMNGKLINLNSIFSKNFEKFFISVQDINKSNYLIESNVGKTNAGFMLHATFEIYAENIPVGDNENET